MTGATQKPRILIIDDDPDLSAMLREYLEAEGFAVAAAFNGEEGVRAIRGDSPDAVILDIMMPSMSGTEVLKTVRLDSGVPVIMLTAKGDYVDRIIGLELGADDYLAKPFHPRELVARLRAVLRRRESTSTADEAPLSFDGLRVHPAARRVVWQEAPVEVTASEFNLLVALVQSGERVATKDDLSLKVLGRARQAYDRSVDVHVSNLRHKLLHVSNGRLEIETVRGIGYRLKAASS